MKKVLLCAVVLSFVAQSVFAQTQQGYVKTRGKLAADGKSVIEGKRLNNAVVTIENRTPVKSGNNGTFSFVLPAGTNYYRVQSVELKGFVLADPDALQQQHEYSKNLPLILVLEDKAQREVDLEAARRSVRNTMKREIRKKQDEIDSLLEAKVISDAEHDSLMRDFWEYRQSSEKLVDTMAKRYVSIDYDQLDDFNRQVQAYIEQGELVKADSMIRSKGSLQERYSRLKQYEAANAQRETEIKQEQDALDKSRQFAQKEKEDLSNDLYRQHLIFLQQPLMQDSALWCLKSRADLDTNNIDAVLDYALLAHHQYNIAEAEKYYLICYRAYTNQNNQFKLTILQNNLVTLYRDKGDYGSCIKYCMQSLNRSAKEFAENPQNNHYRTHLAHSQLNLGILYRDYYVFSSNSRFADSSEMYFKMALGHFERLSAREPDNRWDLALAQNNLGNIYMLKKDHINSEKYYNLALATYRKLDTTIDANKDGYAQTLFNLGDLNYNRQNDVSSEMYYKLALGKFGQLYVNNHDAYRDKLILTYSNLLLMYAENRQIKNKAEILGKYRSLFINDTTAIGLLQNNAIANLCKIAINYAYQQEYSYAVCIIDEAIVLMPHSADLYEIKGFLLLNLNKDQEALNMWHKVLELNPNFLDDYPDGTNLSNGLKSKGLIK